METLVSAYTPISAITSAKAELREKAALEFFSLIKKDRICMTKVWCDRASNIIKVNDLAGD